MPEVCQQGLTRAGAKRAGESLSRRASGLDGTEGAEQVVEVDLLVLPEAHMAAVGADGGGGVGHEGGHLLHVLRVHLFVAAPVRARTLISCRRSNTCNRRLKGSVGLRFVGDI